MARNVRMYEVEVTHSGLNKYRHIRGSDRRVVEQKARILKAQWDDEWERKQEKEAQLQLKQQAQQDKLLEKERLQQAKEERRLSAEQRAEEAKNAISQIQNTLNHTLDINDAINWDSLKDRRRYPQPQPTKSVLPTFVPVAIPRKPQPEDEAYQPKLNWLCRLSKSKKAARIREAKLLFTQDFKTWQTKKANTEALNLQKLKQYKQDLERQEREYLQALREYESAKAAFKEEQLNNNALIDRQKELYLSGDAGAVLDYCEMVLANSQYPDPFPQDYDLDYKPDVKMLIVEYQLPSLDHLPSIKDVRYLKSKDEIQEIELAAKEKEKLYDDLIYQITLRTLHELFEADTANAVDSIIFNGLVAAVDKTNGQETTGCIVSIQTGKAEFMAINLAQVDPKACFKALKGVGSSQLHSLTPIPPILMIDKADKRFVNSYDVAAMLDDSTNLAAMPWEDFEHLIRELFEKEFSQNGGECKVTRASRDGGVDAIAFDPDPIRGGKIVIQAKRYTKTVGVSAVRDLYGTVVNEGATKGILVSTADYGPDSYEFAKGKPLTLLNGANLLHLLANHGHKAKIDLLAARAS